MNRYVWMGHDPMIEVWAYMHPPPPPPSSTLTDDEKLVTLALLAVSVARRASGSALPAWCGCFLRAPSASESSAAAGRTGSVCMGRAVDAARCT